MKLIPLVIVVAVAVILLALSPASLSHKNPQRRHGMRPVERKDRSWRCFFRVSRHVISVAVIVAVVQRSILVLVFFVL